MYLDISAIPHQRRILIVTGHYGSGKTEFAVSLAMSISRSNDARQSQVALCDLDVVNPYFRSREQTEMLKKAGISVYGGIFGTGSTAEIPELAADIRAPLENKDCFSIVDAGGDDSGARILNQFSKYFTREARHTVAVINAARPNTSNTDGALAQIQSIEREIGFEVDALVSNTHMLMETTPKDIIKGYELCINIQNKTGKPIFCCCYPEKLISAESLAEISAPLMPLGMYMRQSWLDK